MSTTPNYFTRTMVAGARANVVGSARFLTIYSMTPGVGLEFGFEDDQLITLGGPLTIDFGVEDTRRRFTRVVFRNTDALLPATVTGYFSNVRIEGVFSELTTLVAIQALLTSIQTLVKIPDTPTLIARQAVAVLGGGGTHLVTAAAANRRILIQADDQNGLGYVYLNFTDPATAVNRFAKLAAGDTWQENFAGHVWANSDNGTEQVSGYVLKIS